MFRQRTPPDAIDLVTKLLQYTPTARLSAVEAMCHPFFDEIKQASCKLPDGRSLKPELFDLTDEELRSRPNLVRRMIPEWKVQEYIERGLELLEDSQ